MKKLLFSLGTVASIVAPVAVAVSCGSKKDHNTQLSIKDQIIKKAYEDYGYTVKFGKDEEHKTSFNQLVKDATSIKLFGGKITDDSNKDLYHDADDLAIVVYGKSLTLPADASDKVFYNADASLTSGSEQVVAGQENATQTFKVKWGFANDDLKNAQAIIFMHCVESSQGDYDISWETAQVYNGKIGNESKNWIKDIASNETASGDDIDMSEEVASN